MNFVKFVAGLIRRYNPDYGNNEILNNKFQIVRVIYLMIDACIFRDFKTVSLEDMEKVRLMNRVDTKYIADIRRINRLLEMASEDYMLQEIDGEFNMPYYTCYFDTPDVNMFYEHERGKKTRQKIRIRKYEGSETSPFLEIKSKNNKGRTHKKRISMEEGESLSIYSSFISKHSFYFEEELSPKIENHFFRITLVNREMTERITIDTGLEFHNFATDSHLNLNRLGIIEWKRDGLNCASGLKEILLELRIHQSGFSKYCMGMAMTDSSLRQNRLKKKVRLVEKILSDHDRSI